MKNKKSLLSFGLLALILVLGVGYAAVSSVSLTIDGTATVEDASIKVSFKSVEVGKADGSNVEVTNTVTDGAVKDTFSISMMDLNETVTLTYTVQNKETDVAAVLTEKTVLTNTNETHFEASYKINDANIAVGGTTTVTVTVTLIKTPVNSTDNSATFNLVLDASPAGATN